MVTMGPSVALPAVKAGKINMLGFGSAKRVPQIPDVPTIAETVPGYEAGVSFGLFALAATPREIDRQDQCRRAEDHQRSGVSQRSSSSRMVVQPMPGSLEAFADYLRRESAKWAKVIKRANLKID